MELSSPMKQPVYYTLILTRIYRVTILQTKTTVNKITDTTNVCTMLRVLFDIYIYIYSHFIDVSLPKKLYHTIFPTQLPSFDYRRNISSLKFEHICIYKTQSLVQQHKKHSHAIYSVYLTIIIYGFRLNTYKCCRNWRNLGYL